MSNTPQITIQSNKIFRPVHGSEKRYVVMRGSAGSGKSVDTAQQYILRLMADKGRNLLCVRKAEVTNRDSTFAELAGAVNRMGLSRYWKTTLTPMTLQCVNGNKIIFRGVNNEKEREKLKSISTETGKLTDVWIEEATEITQQDLEIIDDRLRGELPDNLFYQIKMTFNPVNVNHWLKKKYFDNPKEDALTHHSTYLDNRFCDEAYYRRMEARKQDDPDGYRVYGLGEWGETQGLILQNWEPKETSLNLADYDAVTMGQDFGYNHANAILLLGFKDDNVYILKEVYVYEQATDKIIELAKTENLPQDITMYCDSAEPDRIQMWRDAGFRAEAVVKENAPGKKYTNVQIDWLKQRRIYVNPACVFTIKELSQWKWKYDSTRDIYTDEPVAFMDDAIAALRYGVEGQRKPPVKKSAGTW